MKSALARKFALFMALTWLPGVSTATLSVFEHGSGIKAQGAAGVSYVLGSEGTAIAANPAHVLHMADRFDVGVNIFNPHLNAEFVGNAAGPDQNYKNHGSTYLPIPQMALIRRLSPDWKIGVSAFSAGLISDYDNSPYERFNSASRSNFQFANGGLLLATAREISEGQVLGASLNLSYQTVRANGLEFTQAVSESPEFTNGQGKDGAFGVGFTLGWLGKLSEHLTAALVYRSKTWTEKHDEYRGLLPDQGRLELPQVFGGGLAYRPDSRWAFAFEYQHFHHSSQAAFGNQLEALNRGNLLGSDNGPGFGFGNLNAYKFGVEWKATPCLTLRAGYITAEQSGQKSETLFNVLGNSYPTTHFTGGLTYTIKAWEVSAYGAHAKNQTLHGENSIPAVLGGGEVNSSFEIVTFGLSVGRRF